MNLMEIALKNLLRRKAKAAFVLVGLVSGVAAVVAVVAFTAAVTADINQKIEKFGANILVVPRTDNLNLSYGGISLGGVSFDLEEIHQADLQQIGSIRNARNIAAVGPMVLGAVHVDNHRVMLAGVDFEASRILKPWWRIQGRLPGADGILVGAEAARVLGLEVNRTARLEGRVFHVSGILASNGSQDDHLIFASLQNAQQLLNKPDRVTMVEVAALCTECPVDDMVGQISAVLPGTRVMAIQQVVKSRMQTLAQFRYFSLGICAVSLLVGGLVVLVTMMGSVRERTGEIGIFRAIGFRRAHVMRIVFMETAAVSLLAGLMGYALGALGSRLALRLMDLATDSAASAFRPDLLAGAMALALLTGLSASVYPALAAARLDPNAALRSI